MAKIFKLNTTPPARLGHRKARKGKKGLMERKGQMNLFERPRPKILPMAQPGGPFESALLHDERGDSRAAELYQKAIAKEDCVADAYCNLGIIHANNGDSSKAIDCFTQALVREPRHYEAHFNLANLYFDNGNLHLARLHYQTAIEIEPEDPNIHFNLGLVHALSEEYDKAIDCLQTYADNVSPAEAAPAEELIQTLSLSQQK